MEVFEGQVAEIVAPEVRIEDAPRFEYRGMMFDVARNFQTKKSMKKLLELLSFYKIDKFHFHLCGVTNLYLDMAYSNDPR